MKVSINFTDNQFSDSMKTEMWNIYKIYYNHSMEDFMKRLSRNNQFAIYKHNGNIVGFTGLSLDYTKVGGKSSLLIYFGQTVIKKEYRGKSLLQFTGLKLCLKYFKKLFFSDIYFWCDALTYKSYLVCAKSLSICYPSRKQQTPDSAKKLINYIGHKYYKDSFCPTSGIVRKSTNLVSDSSVSINSKDQQDADIQFFMKANPNHERGHGLLTLAPLNVKTFVRILGRFLDPTKFQPIQHLLIYLYKLRHAVSTRSLGTLSSN